MVTKKTGAKKPAAKRRAATGNGRRKKAAAPTATARSAGVATLMGEGVEAMAAETGSFGKREDRQSGGTNYGRPFDRDRFNAGAGPQGPVEQGYVGSTGPTLSPSVATKTLTLTIGAGTLTPAVAGAVVSYLVQWGDGLSDTYTSAGAKTHVYATAGTWTVTCEQIVVDAKGAGIGGATKTTTATTT